jgi:hypothetical protein
VKVCAKSGADDCFLNLKGESANTLYLFQVKCPANCDFDLRAEYISSEQLAFGQRHFVRMEDFSSKVIELRIPSGTTNQSGTTKMIEVDVEGENSHEELVAYLSLDSELTQVEDTDQTPFYLSNGKAFKFSSTDQGWCTRCSVYLMISAGAAGKFFVSPITYSSKEQIVAEQYTRLIVEQQGQECLEYTVASATADLVVEIIDLEGTSQVTVNPRTVKSSQETSLAVSPLQPKRVVALSADLRNQPGADVRKGGYQLCVNAIQKASVLLKVEEKTLRGRYAVEDDVFYKVAIEAGQSATFLYTARVPRDRPTQFNAMV